MKLAREMQLRFRTARRLGAFSCAVRKGMSSGDARAYSDQLYPPTTEDLKFEAALRGGAATPFPVASALSLLYPIAAGFYIARAPASGLAVVGYALANLGYVLFAAGVFRGTFLIFGLRKRGQVFALGVLSFVGGILLANFRA